MAAWKTLSSDIVYETPWVKVHRDKVLNHRGTELTYSYMSLQHQAVTILALNDKGEIFLQRNYRYPLKAIAWELPSGHSDGQDPLVAAKRELFEETGMTSNDWSSLGTTHLATGVANIKHYLFLARNVSVTNDERDEDEDISEQKFIPIEQVKSMLQSCEIDDGDSMITIFQYLLKEQL